MVLRNIGHILDAEGLQSVEKKVKAITEASSSTSVMDLKSYLGLLNYYKFLTNLAALLTPLHKPLRNNVPCKWKKMPGRELLEIKDFFAIS